MLATAFLRCDSIKQACAFARGAICATIVPQSCLRILYHKDGNKASIIENMSVFGYAFLSRPMSFMRLGVEMSIPTRLYCANVSHTA